MGLLRYNADDDILSMFAIGPTAPNVRLYYSRDGLDPDDDNPTSEVGSGSFTFQGTTYEGLAARTDFLDSWTIVPTDGAYIGFTVLGVPSTDGTSTIADDGLLATFTTASGTQYVAGSGSATRSGDNLTFSFEIFPGNQNRPCRGLADRPDDRARGRYDRDSPDRIIRGYRRTRRVCFAGDSGPLHGR